MLVGILALIINLLDDVLLMFVVASRRRELLIWEHL
jgi:hypothetical protein